MTGAPIPEGADGVIMQERTDEGSESVEIYQSVASYGNYCKEGEDTYRGALLMEKGRSIHSSHIGILSSQGIETIPVYSVPVVAIMATGMNWCLWEPLWSRERFMTAMAPFLPPE